MDEFNKLNRKINSEILVPYINIAWQGATPILEESQNTETNE